MVQDGSVSVWRRTPNQLTYSLLGLHKLVPPPSRVNNNATISLLCAAASAWVRPKLMTAPCNREPHCANSVGIPASHCLHASGRVQSPRVPIHTTTFQLCRQFSMF